MKILIDQALLENSFDALNHCLTYFEEKKPNGCGFNDDRDCSPYNDAKEAFHLLMQALNEIQKERKTK